MPIYRLSIMFNRIPALDFMGPRSQNGPGAKAAFYLFHAMPEWLTSVVLVVLNVRKIFGTGFWGDWRNADDTREEQAKRRAKQAAKENARLVGGGIQTP